MWKAGTLLASCAVLSLGLSLSSPANADDDWDDYYEDLEDAREDYYDDLEDYYDDLDDRRIRYRTFRYGYAPRVYVAPSYRSYGYCQPYGSYYSPGYRSVYYGPRYYSRPRVGVWIGRW